MRVKIKRIFSSGLELEESFIELRILVKSYFEVSGEDVSALLHTIDRSVECVGEKLSAHQVILASCRRPL